MSNGVSFTLQQDSQKKWRGHAPTSLKSGGATAPRPPGSAAYTKTISWNNSFTLIENEVWIQGNSALL